MHNSKIDICYRKQVKAKVENKVGNWLKWNGRKRVPKEGTLNPTSVMERAGIEQCENKCVALRSRRP